MFDCKAEFEGKSVNKELLTGPDLANHFVSILIRFCEERVAVMDDVESMYYQVQIPENQQTYLKFYGGKTTTKNVTHKSLPCVHMCTIALLLEVVPIMLYAQLQWTMMLNLEGLL